MRHTMIRNWTVACVSLSLCVCTTTCRYSNDCIRYLLSSFLSLQPIYSCTAESVCDSRHGRCCRQRENVVARFNFLLLLTSSLFLYTISFSSCKKGVVLLTSPLRCEALRQQLERKLSTSPLHDTSVFFLNPSLPYILLPTTSPSFTYCTLSFHLLKIEMDRKRE